MVLYTDNATKCLLSTNERAFILKALQENTRVDGRKPDDFRKIDIQIALDGSTVTLQLGQTVVATTVTATIEAPNPDRPSEGVVRLNVEHVPLAAPGLDADVRQSGVYATELAMQLDKAIHNARAVDLEALCIMAGQKVWRIQLDVRLLDACGNSTDACFLCATTALMAFRRPDVSVDTGQDGLQRTVKVYSTDERETVPISLHQIPIAVTFALFKEGDLVVVDPSMKEEAAAEGFVSVVLNAHNEICLLSKTGGIGLPPSQIKALLRKANAKVEDLSFKIQEALQKNESARVAARVRRKTPKAPAASQTRSVVSQRSTLIQGIASFGKNPLAKEFRDLEMAVKQKTSSDEEMDDAVRVKREGSTDSENKHVPLGVLAPQSP